MQIYISRDHAKFLTSLSTACKALNSVSFEFESNRLGRNMNEMYIYKMLETYFLYLAQGLYSAFVLRIFPDLERWLCLLVVYLISLR